MAERLVRNIYLDPVDPLRANPGTMRMMNPMGSGRNNVVLYEALQDVPPEYLPIINKSGLPDQNSFNVKVVSDLGVGAADTRVYLFNQDLLNNIDNNGSGAGSIRYTYLDNFDGKLQSELLGLARGGKGALFRAVALNIVTTATNVADPVSLMNSNPKFQAYNFFGDYIPLNFGITEGQGRKDFYQGIEVIECMINMLRNTQYSFIVTPGTTATITFYTKPYNFTV